MLDSTPPIPPAFTVVMPDDSLAGHIDKGERMIFERDFAPSPGKTVLIEDGEGNRFIRLYAPAGDRWQARASNESYVTLDSEAHSLRVLATMRWREG